jgi:hypothetical protein
MDHVEFLVMMKRIFRPETYIEIGVAAGVTLFSDPIPDFVIGIDPNPQWTAAIAERISACRGLLMMRSTSDEAFAALASQNILGQRRLDFAFVDGMHHCEVVLRDIANCARFSQHGALIFVHDVFPANEHQASRQIVEGSWMGDVYKVVPLIWRFLGWVPTLLIKDILPSGMFILRVTGDLHNAIFSQYDALVAAMGGYVLAPTLEDMNGRCVSRTSPALAAFIEQSQGRPSAAKSSQDEVDFDEDWYLRTNPDVAEAVRTSVIGSGRQHYLAHGRAEGRKPRR